MKLEDLEWNHSSNPLFLMSESIEILLRMNRERICTKDDAIDRNHFDVSARLRNGAARSSNQADPLPILFGSSVQ